MIEHLFLTVAWIWGIKAITSEPFIFWKQAEYIESKIGIWLSRPFFRCPVCMPSVWGTYFFFYYDQVGIMNWVTFVICLSGINYLIVEYLYPENKS